MLWFFLSTIMSYSNIYFFRNFSKKIEWSSKLIEENSFINSSFLLLELVECDNFLYSHRGCWWSTVKTITRMYPFLEEYTLVVYLFSS